MAFLRVTEIILFEWICGQRCWIFEARTGGRTPRVSERGRRNHGTPYISHMFVMVRPRFPVGYLALPHDERSEEWGSQRPHCSQWSNLFTPLSGVCLLENGVPQVWVPRDLDYSWHEKFELMCSQGFDTSTSVWPRVRVPSFSNLTAKAICMSSLLVMAALVQLGL